ncbi:MAG: sigma-54 dependent transcriptional regulator, partial [Gammaproteobacteria bacterium]
MNTPGNDKARRILLVDDDPGLLRLLTIRLRAEGFEVSGVTNATEALASAATFRPDLVITDLRMDGMDGIALLSELQRRWPGLRVILITAHGTIPDAVQATQRGAYSFLTKPIEKDELLEQVNKALELSGMTAAGEDWSAEIITRSPVMEEVLRQAGMAASIDDPILIFGESGTGKELLARAIHRASPRNAKGFVTVGCRAAEEDIDAELFGSSVGAMERASGGTLMLDEIGELPLSLQGKLLRALERKRVTGPSGEAVSVDVRLISTTQAELSDAVDDGHFREDLFYRLGEVKLGMPTLTDRREDIPLLVSHFLSELTDQKVYAPDAMELLVTTT